MNFEYSRFFGPPFCAWIFFMKRFHNPKRIRKVSRIMQPAPLDLVISVAQQQLPNVKREDVEAYVKGLCNC